jgi:hypothetical protein
MADRDLAIDTLRNCTTLNGELRFPTIKPHLDFSSSCANLNVAVLQ